MSETIRVIDGWFEENEDGGRDYIAVLPNGDKIRCKNIYLASVEFVGFDYSGESEPATIESVLNFEKY
jgi:hypothetical protein